MEAMQAKQKRAGLTMHDDPSMRYRARPGVPSSTSQRQYINGNLVSSRTNFIGAKTKITAPTDPDSDDEINSLNGSQVDSDDEERTKITRVGSKKKNEEHLLDVNGQKLPAHPDFLPSKKPLPKFKKNKTAPTDSSTSSEASPFSSQTRAQPIASGSSTPVNLAALRNNENGNLPKAASFSRSRSTSSLARADSSDRGVKRPAANKRPLGSYPQPSSLTHSRSPSLEVLPPEPTKKGKERAKAKPAPFPLGDRSSASQADNRPSLSRASSPPPTRPPNTRPPRTSAPARKVNKRRIESDSELSSDGDLFGSGEETTPRGKVARPSVIRTSPTSSRTSPTIDLTEGTRTPAERPKPKPKPKKKAASNFPALSPLSSQADAGDACEPTSTPKRKKKGISFPALSPLSSPVSAPLSREKTNPFPMSMSPLKLSPVSEVVDEAPNAPIWEESEHDDHGGDSSSDEEGELCPYCDVPMPSIEERTPQLTRLLAAAERRSKPAPRPGHPYARRAPVSVHGAVCERHDFETKELPRARAKGWPTNIAWDALRGRIERLQPKLEKLVKGDEEARGGSAFWRSVEEDVRKSGSRAVAGVKGQFESFDKVQPGYYGEKGAHIIYQTIYNLFPPSSFDVQSLSALSPDIVLQRVLVPEAALALVMEDLEVDASMASRILVESARFGAMMHPLHDGDQDQRDDIGHGMVRERARARAKVLKVEERVEEEMLREEKEKRRKREELSETGSAEGERRARSKRRKPTPDVSVPSDGGEASLPARAPRPRTRAASRQLESDSDASVRSAVSTRSTRSRKGAAPKPVSGSDSDTIEIVEDMKSTRPKPRKVAKRAGAASSDMDVSSGAEPTNDVDATPRPLARQRQTKESAKGAVASKRFDWSRSQRQDLTPEDEDEPPAPSRRSRSRALEVDKSRAGSQSWLLSDASQ